MGLTTLITKECLPELKRVQEYIQNIAGHSLIWDIDNYCHAWFDTDKETAKILVAGLCILGYKPVLRNWKVAVNAKVLIGATCNEDNKLVFRLTGGCSKEFWE